MQLKHFFVFLLVFFLSIVESTTYSQKSGSSYFKSSKVIQKKRITNTKHFVFNKTLASKYFLVSLLSLIQQENVLKKQIQNIIKLQKQLYQEIALFNNQHVFLINKITVSNFNS